MNIFKLISSLFGNKTQNDKFFGELKLYQPQPEYWKGQVFFVPAAKNISILIPGRNGEISEMHYKFYQDVEQKYAGLADRIAALLQDAFSYEGASVSLDDVWNKFSLAQMFLPPVEELNSSSFKWEIDYSYELEHPQYTIELMNWEPISSYYSE